MTMSRLRLTLVHLALAHNCLRASVVRHGVTDVRCAATVAGRFATLERQRFPHKACCGTNNGRLAIACALSRDTTRQRVRMQPKAVTLVRKFATLVDLLATHDRSTRPQTGTKTSFGHLRTCQRRRHAGDECSARL